MTGPRPDYLLDVLGRVALASSFFVAGVCVSSIGPIQGASADGGSISVSRSDPRDEFGYWDIVDDDSSGEIAPLVVGGAPISIQAAPWQVLLVDYDPDYWWPRIGQNYSSYCGGSIIHERWIVTAAHCVDDPYYWQWLQVASGVTMQAGISDGHFTAVENVIVHENWIPATSENDIALLELAEPLELSGATRQAIDLPVGVAASWPTWGTDAFISGWGTTSSGGTTPNQLRGATVDVLASPGSEDCGSYGAEYFPASMLCAGVTEGGKDTCQGDSGGPLAIQVSGRWTLGGITSWGTGCALAEFPGLYTRVTAYLDWIAENVPLASSTPVITSIEGGNGVLRVAFEPPSGGAPISNFAYSIDGARWITPRSTSLSSPLTIGRLTNGRSYSVRIAAVTASGLGSPSNAVAGVPVPDPPSAPTIRSVSGANSSLRVLFAAPTNNGGAPVTGYQFSLDNGASWAPAIIGSRESLILSGLVNGVGYSVRIRAVNARGPGSPSASASGTPRTTPGAPMITGVSRSTGSATLTFGSPVSNGGAPITTYEYSVNGGRWTARRPVSSSSPLVITGLIDSRTYSVRIRAVNSVGVGLSSSDFVLSPRAVG